MEFHAWIKDRRGVKTLAWFLSMRFQEGGGVRSEKKKPLVESLRSSAPRSPMIVTLCDKEELRGKLTSEFTYTWRHMCCSFVFVLRISRSSERSGDQGSWHSALPYRFISPSFSVFDAKEPYGRRSTCARGAAVILNSKQLCWLSSASREPRTPTLHASAPNERANPTPQPPSVLLKAKKKKKRKKVIASLWHKSSLPKLTTMLLFSLCVRGSNRLIGAWGKDRKLIIAAQEASWTRTRTLLVTASVWLQSKKITDINSERRETKRSLR